MAILTLTNIKKSYGDRELFGNISFAINARERVALIGANGCGKTTLLRIIAGDIEADGGNINAEQGLTVGYLAQDVDLDTDSRLLTSVLGINEELYNAAITLDNLQQIIADGSADDEHRVGHALADASHTFDTLGGYSVQAEAKATLMGLGFIESELNNYVRELSGGQKTRAALAKLLLQAPDMLLLDEPTNHLDINACEWLQEYLRTRYSGAALIVSHDRYFLDKVVSRVIEMDSVGLIEYPGNYSDYARQRAEKIEEQRKLYKEQQKEIARLESAIQTLFSHRKFSRRDSKQKQLDKIQRVSKSVDGSSIKIRFASGIKSGREVLRLHELTKTYPGKPLFKEFSYLLERGRKVGIVGPNGSGKSTLLKIIAGLETADAGELVFGHNVNPVYFSQQFDHLNPDYTVLDELIADSDLSAKQARDLLAKFLFMGDDAFKQVSSLSGGEKCRLALAKVLADSPNFMILDEPTNHLDIQSREALEQALHEYNGTALIASHDRYLLDSVATEIVEIKDCKVSRFLGNYTNYRQKTLGADFESDAKYTKYVTRNEPVKQRNLSSLRELEKEKRLYEKNRDRLENEIQEVESNMEKLTLAMGDEQNYKDGSIKELSVSYDKSSAKLEELYKEWEFVCISIDQIGEKLV